MIDMLRMQVLVEQRIFWRNRSSTFFTFVLPIAMLLVLAVSDDPLEFVPFIVALGVLSTAFQGLAIQLAMHRDQGVLKRIIASPLPAWVLVELAIIVAVSVLAFDAPAPEHPIVLVAVTLLGTATFVALAFAVASLVPTSESAPAVVNGAYLGLILVTSLLGQVDAVPEQLRGLGHALPLLPLFETIEHAWMGGLGASDWWSVLALVLWGVAGAAWTTSHFRWVPIEER